MRTQRHAGWLHVIRTMEINGRGQQMEIDAGGAIRLGAERRWPTYEGLAQGIARLRCVAAMIEYHGHAPRTAAEAMAADVGYEIEGVLELAGLAWRELARGRRSPAEALIAVPSTAPLIAMSADGQTMARLEQAGPLPEPVGEAGQFIWYLELEGAEPQGRLPDAAARWERCHDGNVRESTVCGIWTRGEPRASRKRPLVCTVKRTTGERFVRTGVFRIPAGEDHEDGTDQETAYRCEHTLVEKAIPMLLNPAIDAWRSERGHSAAGGGALGADGRGAWLKTAQCPAPR